MRFLLGFIGYTKEWLSGVRQYKLRTPDKQVGLITAILRKLGREDVTVGASNMPNKGNSSEISPIHFRVMPAFKERKPDGSTESILHKSLTQYPDLLILTGAWMLRYVLPRLLVE